MYEYKAVVYHVVDGDTFDAKVDLGFSVSVNMRFRLYGIDTPELASKDEEERRRAGEALRELESLVKGQEVRILTIKDRREKYGRYLANVFLSTGLEVGLYLKQKGLAKEYRA